MIDDFCEFMLRFGVFDGWQSHHSTTLRKKPFVSPHDKQWINDYRNAILFIV